MATRSTWKSGTRRSSSSSSSSSSSYRNSSMRSGTSSTNSAGYSPVKFSSHRNEISAKICSFRTINQQFNGAGKVTTFSPTTANKWISYVNDGARVYKFTDTQLARMCGPAWSTNCTPTYALRCLKKKFGAGIKACTKGKNSCWLIAASCNVTKRPFSTYNFSC